MSYRHASPLLLPAYPSRQASVLAVVSTAVACIVIFIQILVEVEEHEDPFYQNPTISTFALGFGAILFAFGGSAVFPTVQNDMKDRSQFWKSALVGFAGGSGGGSCRRGEGH